MPSIIHVDVSLVLGTIFVNPVFIKSNMLMLQNNTVKHFVI